LTAIVEVVNGGAGAAEISEVGHSAVLPKKSSCGEYAGAAGREASVGVSGDLAQNNISRLAKLRFVDQQTGRIGIEAKFGKKVAKIVEGCTDSFVEYPDKKQEWEERKSSYIERLWNEPPETLLVSVADKLYNARAILKEYRQIGSEVWSRFKRGGKQQLWYFDELIKVYEERCSTWQIVQELKRTVKELTQISATDRISEPGQTA